ncbi:YebG family protein [Marinomonas posidonica]|uniref:YebG family protein n=1 Tax=Marinomonas posidonica (strain CECT 7376 / NCIMB 14433 / IVIA-Po-181) TaxID=491952 RepID=F6D0U6_MARPP|nr:YebG family protein [Marinomonas posidonica]AEF55978.1 YebG family protein [Marinomonas posidonica IVIA-Po-181]
MSVIIKYVVERHGIEKMTFTSKAEADAYDKLLDTAEALEIILSGSQLVEDDPLRESLAMYLAEHKNSVIDALGPKKKTTSKKKHSQSSQTELALNKTPKSPSASLEDLVIETDEEQIYQEEEAADPFEEGDFDESHAA